MQFHQAKFFKFPSVASGSFCSLSPNESISTDIEVTIDNKSTDLEKPLNEIPLKKKRLKLIFESQPYTFLEVIGKGTFGIVYKAQIKSNPELFYAIKQLPYNETYSKRELILWASLDHPNCVRLLTHYLEKKEETNTIGYIYFVMEYFPCNLDGVIYALSKNTSFKSSALVKKSYKIMMIKTYAWQLLEAVSYLHDKSICHRDIKPQNILIDCETHRLALCDFGSAKILNKNMKSVSYVCSRYYRAPELIFGEQEYGLETDIWSVGCVIAEIMLGKPIFQGTTSKDQMVKIMQILGSPSEEDLQAMCPSVKVFLPDVKSCGLDSIFVKANSLFVDLIKQMLVYNPRKRITAKIALLHPFFTSLSKGRKKEKESENECPLLENLRSGFA